MDVKDNIQENWFHYQEKYFHYVINVIISQNVALTGISPLFFYFGFYSLNNETFNGTAIFPTFQGFLLAFKGYNILGDLKMKYLRTCIEANLLDFPQIFLSNGIPGNK